MDDITPFLVIEALLFASLFLMSRESSVANRLGAIITVSLFIGLAVVAVLVVSPSL